MDIDMFGTIVMAIAFLVAFYWGYRNGRKNLIHELKDSDILSTNYAKETLFILAFDLHGAFKESIEFQNKTIEAKYLDAADRADQSRIETSVKERKDRFWKAAKLAHKTGLIKFLPGSYKQCLRD